MMTELSLLPWVLAGGLGVAALLGLLWWLRARASRRLHAALDVYARREIARGRRKPAARKLPTFSAPARPW
jgi:hypothetical protein